MSFKTTIAIMPEKLEAKEVTIPDNCPHCGFDLHEGLTEVAFTLTAAEGNLHDTDGFEPGGSSDTYHETEHVTGYECGGCGSSVLPE